MATKPNLWTLDEIEEKQRKKFACLEDELNSYDLEAGNKKRRKNIMRFWKDGKIELLITLLGIRSGMRFVHDNIEELREMHMYERALLYAFSGVETSLHHWPFKEIKHMFEIADPDRMQAAGDEVPNQETFTLYRGVAGNGPAKRVKSVSWTASVEVAAFFAMRFNHPDPAVYQIVVSNKEILAHNSGRSESEYLLKPSSIPQPKRIPENQMKQAYQEYKKNRYHKN